MAFLDCEVGSTDLLKVVSQDLREGASDKCRIVASSRAGLKLVSG